MTRPQTPARPSMPIGRMGLNATVKVAGHLVLTGRHCMVVGADGKLMERVR
jgi:hypothetical protein